MSFLVAIFWVVREDLDETSNSRSGGAEVQRDKPRGEGVDEVVEGISITDSVDCRVCCYNK